MADKVGDIVVPRGPDMPDPALMLSFDRDLNKQLTDYLTALARKANAGDITDGGVIVGDIDLTGDFTQTGDFSLTGNFLGSGTFGWTGDGSFSGALTVADEAYDEAGWNADLSVPTKNAVRDKIEFMLGTTLPAAYQPLDTDLTQIAGLTRNRGDIIRGGAAAWEDVALGASGTFFKSDGTDALWVSQPTLVSLEGLTLNAGDLLYATAADTLADLAIGTARQALLVNAGATAPVWTTLPFTQSFESAGQTITDSGALTIAHGLSAQPTLYTAYLINTSAELGYSVDDELAINIASNSEASLNRGLSVVPDSTNLNVRFGSSPIQIIRKDTGASAQITNASWELVLRAWV